MDQSPPSTSDLVVPPPPETGTGQPFRVYVFRQPWDDYFLLKFTKQGREVSEELEPDETRKFFLDRFTKPLSKKQLAEREEALDKALDECWNFAHTVITIPADLYQEPALPFPQFQPKV
jgi:hypothetical protein